MTTDGNGLARGDKLRIERRYVVDGQLTSVTDEGRYAGVERVGSAEHLVLKDAKRKVRMIPLHAIAEITLVRSAPRKSPTAEAQPVETARPAWDPGFA